MNQIHHPFERMKHKTLLSAKKLITFLSMAKRLCR